LRLVDSLPIDSIRSIVLDDLSPRPRVVVADDQEVILDLLERLLDNDFDVVATAADGAALVDVVARCAPDVIVTDVSMPRLDGLAAARVILRANPVARIVFVTVHGDGTTMRRGQELGGLGYVPKALAGDELVPTVWAVLRGERRFLCS
jgi:DNA-binding NarL/FixJ family response regulator